MIYVKINEVGHSFIVNSKWILPATDKLRM